MNFSSSKLLSAIRSFCSIVNNPKYISHYGKGSGYRRQFWSSLYLNQKRTFTHSVENYIKLYSKDLHVNPGFGVFRANGTINFVVKPANPQEYPDADRAFINVYGLPSAVYESINIELTGELQDTLSITASPKTPEMCCEVMIPIKYDLDMHLLEKASMEISGMEADEVKLSTEMGEIKTRGLKSHNIHINTDEGHITSEGSLQGNIFINAKKTNFKAKRLQGLVMDIEAEDLTIAVESSYMNQGQISAQHGDVKISNLHGCTDLMIRNGSIVVTGFHGQLSGFLGSGRIEAQVTDVTGHSTLHLKEGHLALSILDNPRHSLEVSAPELEISDEVKMLGTTSNTSTSASTFTVTHSDPAASLLKASVKNGSAQVKCQNWFSTLGIKLEREN